MPSKINTIFGLGQLALAMAAPLAARAPTEAEATTVDVANGITYLAGYLMNNSASDAQNVYNLTRANLASLGAQLGDSCAPMIRPGTAADLDDAITALNNTQNYLGQVLLALPNQGTEEADNSITEYYCHANATLGTVETYTFDIVGNSGVQQYEPTFAISETNAQLSLQGLQSSLRVISNGDPATTEAKQAYNSTQTAIALFARLAGLSGPYSCPAFTSAPANDATDAYGYAYELEATTVPRAYERTVAEGSADLTDFCYIGDYMAAIDDYVQA